MYVYVYIYIYNKKVILWFHNDISAFAGCSQILYAKYVLYWRRRAAALDIANINIVLLKA
jgi:hypothetical protein